MELTRRSFLKTTTLGTMGYIEKYHFPQKKERVIRDLTIGDSMVWYWKREGINITKPNVGSGFLEKKVKKRGEIICNDAILWTGTAESAFCNNGDLELGELCKNTSNLIDTIYENVSYMNMTILSPFNCTNSKNKEVVDELNYWIRIHYADYLDIRPFFFDMETGKVQKDKRNMFRDILHLSELGYKYLEECLSECQKLEKRNNKW